MQKRLLVAIEGIDGVGKTTIAELLEAELKAVRVKTPLRFLRGLAVLLEKTKSQEIEAVGYFFLAFLSSLYFAFIRRKRHVICDKYVLVTIVDQIVLGSRAAKFLKKVRYLFVPKPDYTFFLYVGDRCELERRLKKREKLDKNDVQMLPFWEAIQVEYLKMPEVIFIDTTNILPKEVVSVIMSRINGRAK